MSIYKVEFLLADFAHDSARNNIFIFQLFNIRKDSDFPKFLRIFIQIKFFERIFFKTQSLTSAS